MKEPTEIPGNIDEWSIPLDKTKIRESMPGIRVKRERAGQKKIKERGANG